MQPEKVPEGLADLPPGPALCTALAGIDPTRVANGDTVDLLQGWRRLGSYVLAQEMTAMAEVGRCDPYAVPDHHVRTDRPDRGCGPEIAAALTITELTAWTEHSRAEMLVHRLPAVHAALAAGHVDRGKATVFADLLEPLDDTHATRIASTLLPKAPALTTGQLRARLQRMVLAIDPDAARRRYRKALHERRVICYLDDEGTATISVTGLDPSAAQAACERVDTLARDIRAAGHPDPLSRIRADLSAALLDGSLHTLTEAQIIATMITRATAPDPEFAPARSGNGGRGSDGDGTGGGDDGPGRTDGNQGGSGSEPDDSADDGSDDTDDPDDGGPDDPDDGGPDDGGPDDSGDDNDHDDDGPGSGNPEDDGPDESGPGGPGPGGSGPDGSGPEDDNPRPGGPDNGAGGAERARHGIEIRIRLTTLLGHDDHPAELPGLGPIPAATARACVTRHPHAEWRFAITDPDGYLLLAGTTRRRPPPTPAHPLLRPARGGTVELQVPAEALAALATHPPPGWEALIADLTTQYAQRDRLRAALDHRPQDRFPHPALRRHVEVRDRTCVFPGCRRPARKTQQDHTREHRHGGPSVAHNLGPLCVLHHSLKTVGLWRLHQPAPGSFRWHSPLGRVYATRGEPVCPPLLEPAPGDRCTEPDPPPAPPLPADLEHDELPLFRPAPRTTPSARTTGRAPPDHPDEDPPF